MLLQKLANPVTLYQTPPFTAIHMMIIRRRLGAVVMPSLCQDFVVRAEGGVVLGKEWP